FLCSIVAQRGVAAVARHGEWDEIGQDQLPPDRPVSRSDLRPLVDAVEDRPDDHGDRERAPDRRPRKGALECLASDHQKLSGTTSRTPGRPLSCRTTSALIGSSTATKATASPAPSRPPSLK